MQPPTEKVHQIIARTAKFVSEHGGQSEIVLRVKQGDNPTFGFLMPDHHLHAYFRFLVDHQELLKNETDLKAVEEKKKIASGKNQAHVAGGALSLLGSVYGSLEEEDGTLQTDTTSKEVDHDNSVDAVSMTSLHQMNQIESSKNLSVEAEATVHHPCAAAAAANEKASSYKRGSVTVVPSGTILGKKREVETSNSPSDDNPQPTSAMNLSEVKPLVLEPIVEPPSLVKQMVDKTVEFIRRNGKEFEAVLIEQNSTHGKFPFLLPSNLYHPYYLKVLQKAEESKTPLKNLATQKLDLQGHIAGKERGKGMVKSKGDDNSLSKGFSGFVPNTANELPRAFDSERKEKFRMVIGGSKKDAQDQSKSVQRQCGMSADEAAAIVLAATRGRMNHKASSLLKTSFDDSAAGLSVGEGTHTSSTGSLPFPRHAHGSVSETISNGKQESMPEQSDKGGAKGSDVSVAKAIAKTVALVAASEADSSEACLTREQKLKAERLKRAKMFAAMIKGTGQQTSESFPHLSAQTRCSALSDLLDSGGKAPTRSGSLPAAAAEASNHSGSELGDLVGREREGSSAPVDVAFSEKMDRKTYSDDDDADKKRTSRTKHSSRFKRHENDSDKEHKHSRKKHRSEHSSHHRKDDHRHRRSHSKDRDSIHHHRHRHHGSSEDEHHHRSRSNKHRRSHRERELEEGEVDERVSGHSGSMGIEDKTEKAASLDCSNVLREGSVPSVTDNRSSDTTEVPDELRAKVRAMLLATM